MGNLKEIIELHAADEAKEKEKQAEQKRIQILKDRDIRKQEDQKRVIENILKAKDEGWLKNFKIKSKD